MNHKNIVSSDKYYYFACRKHILVLTINYKVMRKISTLLLVVLISLSVSAQKKVGYFTKQKDMDATAATVDNDPIIKMLKSDPNIALSVVIVSDATTGYTADLSGYDAIVVQESFGGGDGILQPAGALAITKLVKPTVYNKTYAFRNGRAIVGGSGTGAEEKGILGITIESTAAGHDLFKGITGTSPELFKSGSADSGADTDTKALNYATGVTMSATNTLLAKPTGSAAAIVMCVNDIPKGTTLESETTAARMIVLGMNFGAMCKNNASNLTTAGLTLWRNAVYSAAGLTVPTTPASSEMQKINNLSYYRDGNRIQVQFGVAQKADVSVYNLAGVLITKMNVNGNVADVDLSGQAKGVYIINVVGNEVRGTQKFVVR
jgi:hypothetical protein